MKLFINILGDPTSISSKQWYYWVVIFPFTIADVCLFRIRKFISGCTDFMKILDKHIFRYNHRETHYSLSLLQITFLWHFPFPFHDLWPLITLYHPSDAIQIVWQDHMFYWISGHIFKNCPTIFSKHPIQKIKLFDGISFWLKTSFQRISS